MSTEKIREARAYLREEYIEKAAQKLSGLPTEGAESTDETQRIRNRQRKRVRRFSAAAALLLLFLIVAIPVIHSHTGFGGDAFWGTIVDGKLYYRTDWGIRVYDPQTQKNRMAVWGEIGAGITRRGEQLFYTDGKNTLYVYDTCTQKINVLTVLTEESKIRDVSICNDLLPENGLIILQYWKEGEYLYYAADPDTGACTPCEAPESWKIKLQFPDILCWSFWDGKIVLGTGQGILIRDPETGEEALLPGIIAETGVRFDGEWLYVAQHGYGGTIYAYHCYYDGEKWGAEDIGQVYQPSPFCFLSSISNKFFAVFG